MLSRSIVQLHSLAYLLPIRPEFRRIPPPLLKFVKISNEPPRISSENSSMSNTATSTTPTTNTAIKGMSVKKVTVVPLNREKPLYTVTNPSSSFSSSFLIPFSPRTNPMNKITRDDSIQKRLPPPLPSLPISNPNRNVLYSKPLPKPPGIASSSSSSSSSSSITSSLSDISTSVTTTPTTLTTSTSTISSSSKLPDNSTPREMMIFSEPLKRRPPPRNSPTSFLELPQKRTLLVPKTLSSNRLRKVHIQQGLPPSATPVPAIASPPDPKSGPVPATPRRPIHRSTSAPLLHSGPFSTVGNRHTRVLNKLMRIADNCICADCSDSAIQYVSVNYGVFLCRTCATIHQALLPLSCVKELSTLAELDQKLDTNCDWSPQMLEFLFMMGNKHANQIWEYNIKPQYRKPLPGDFSTTKEKWIFAKYHEKLFSNPLYVKKNGNDHPNEVRYSLKNPNHTLFREGFLMKQSKLFGWKQRFFVLKDNFLFYYQNKQSSSPSGALFLLDAIADIIDPIAYNISNRVNLFEVRASQQSLLLCANSKEEESQPRDARLKIYPPSSSDPRWCYHAPTHETQQKDVPGSPLKKQNQANLKQQD